MLKSGVVGDFASRFWPLAGLLAGILLSSVVQAQTPVPVKVQALSEVLINMERSAPADVRSLNVATLSAEVTAVVNKINVDAGQTVTQGELLLELDTTDYQLALDQAEASLDSNRAQKVQAEARLIRARELGEKQYLSADDLLARETELVVIAAQIRVQEVNVAIARRNLQKCHILAPFDGVVDERFAQLGAYVSHGSPMLKLTQTDRFELNAEIPDEFASSIKQADSIRFVSRSQTWPVRLLRLSSVVNPERRSRLARLEFTAEAPAIGRSGEILWHSADGLLPVNLVVRRNDKLGIFINQSGKAVFRALAGAQEGRPAPVDLSANTEIIVQGRERLQDGDAITPSR